MACPLVVLGLMCSKCEIVGVHKYSSSRRMNDCYSVNGMKRARPGLRKRRAYGSGSVVRS